MLGAQAKEAGAAEEGGQAGAPPEPASPPAAPGATGEGPPRRAVQQQPSPLLPPPGFSPNHLFGDAEDVPLDLVANLSFLNDSTDQARSLLQSSVWADVAGETSCVSS